MHPQSPWRSVRVHAIDQQVKWLTACVVAYSMGPEKRVVSFKRMKISENVVSAIYIYIIQRAGR